MKYYSAITQEHTCDFVYNLDYWKDYLTDDMQENSVELREQKRDIGGPMFCIIESEFDPECGRKNCSDYTPRNGKNGRCKYLNNGFIETDNIIVLERLDNGKFKIKKGAYDENRVIRFVFMGN